MSRLYNSDKMSRFYPKLLLFFFAMQLQDLYAVPTHADHSKVEIKLAAEFNSNNDSCVHGKISNTAEECTCQPCWSGLSCNVYDDYYAPKFLVHDATVIVTKRVTGAVYRAWSIDNDLGLTCPLGPGKASRCPCASVRFQLFSPAGDHHFVLHPETGILSRAETFNASHGLLKNGQSYEYKLMVQSVPPKGYVENIAYDIMNLKIFVGNHNFAEAFIWN